MTTGISLVRENTASMQPPRALWVSFPLGRPLGKPGDAAFQHRVIATALGLLGEQCGPVLVDYPEDAPTVSLDDAPACPVSFAKPVNNTDPSSYKWTTALQQELQTLSPWHDLGRRRRGGRTLVGVSEYSMTENLQKLGQLLDDNALPTAELNWFKGAIEDAKVFYIEALTAQPGEYDHAQIEQIYWRETRMGAAVLRFSEKFLTDPDLSGFARIISPRHQQNFESK